MSRLTDEQVEALHQRCDEAERALKEATWLTREMGIEMSALKSRVEELTKQRVDTKAAIKGIVRVMRGPAMSEWRPIETAPKDASTVLVYCPELEMVNTAYWGDSALGEGHKDAWYWCWGEPPEADCYATHWMPLPPPPEAK